MPSKTLKSHSKSLKKLVKSKAKSKTRGKIKLGKPVRKTTKRKGMKA